MKFDELLLDIIGVGLILLSIYAFLNGILDFKQSTLVGVGGLALFVLKGSAIRKVIVGIIDKFTK